jgi:glycosyltransferase involved in cell wall biosynthesis
MNIALGKRIPEQRGHGGMGDVSTVFRVETGLPVSVIIPTYNREKLVVRAIDSALKAVSPGDEVIVVDDGSTDGTKTVLARYDGSIRYVLAPHKGAGAARNMGIRSARHDWICFLDSDDEWKPDHLDLHRRFHAKSDIPLSFSNFDIYRDNHPEKGLERMALVKWTRDFRNWDQILGKGIPYSRFAELPPGREDFMVHVGDLYPLMLRKFYVSTFTSFVRRDLTENGIYFREDLPTYEDYDFFVRLSKIGKAAYLDCSTVVNHGHEGPRLTVMDDLTFIDTFLSIIETTYGIDPEYLKEYRDDYMESRNEVRSHLVKQLILRGDTRRARQEIRDMQGVPLSVRTLCLLPGFFARLLSIGYRGIGKLRTYANT